MSDANKLLWEGLTDKELYTKSYPDFVNQFASVESQTALFTELNEKKLYTKSEQAFKDQFFKSTTNYQFFKKPENIEQAKETLQHIKYNTTLDKDEVLKDKIFQKFFNIKASYSEKGGTESGRELFDKLINNFGGEDNFKKMLNDGNKEKGYVDTDFEKFNLFKKIFTEGFNMEDIEAIKNPKIIQEFKNLVDNETAFRIRDKQSSYAKRRKVKKVLPDIKEQSILELISTIPSDGVDDEFYTQNIEDIKKDKDPSIAQGLVEQKSKVLNAEFSVLQKEANSIKLEADKFIKVEDGQNIFTGSETQYRTLLDRQLQIEKEHDELLDKAIVLEDNAAILGVLDYNYKSGYRLLNTLQGVSVSAVGFGVNMIDYTLGIIDPNSPNFKYINRAKEQHMNVLQYYNKMTAETLPPTTKLKDRSLSSFGVVFKETLINNSFSILSALGSMGLMSTATKTATVAGVTKTTVDAARIRFARRMLLGSFFVVEGGGKANEMELAELEASKLSARLNDAYNNATTIEERDKIRDQIEYHTEAGSFKNYSDIQKAVSTMLYGGIATYAEKLGTLRYVTHMSKLLRNPSYSFLMKGVKGAKLNLFNVGIEVLEESATQFGHNFVDKLILKEDKSLLDGLDVDFFFNVAASSLAIQGPSVGQNVYQSFVDGLRSTGDYMKARKITRKFINLAAEIKEVRNQKIGTTGRADQIRQLRKEMGETLKEAQMLDKLTITNAMGLTSKEITTLYKNEAEQSKILRKARQLAFTSTKYSKRKTQEYKNKLQELYRQNDDILKRPKDRQNKKLEEAARKEKVEVTIEMQKAIGMYEYKKNLVPGSGLKLVVIQGENAVQELRKELKRLGKSEAYINEAVDGYNKNANALEVDNEVFLFEDNVYSNIVKGDFIFAPLAAMEEVGHSYDRQTGIVTNGKVVEGVRNQLESIAKDLSILLQEGKNGVTKELIAKVQKRINQYKKDGKFNHVELLQQLNLLVAGGYIKSNNKSSVLSAGSILRLVHRLQMGRDLAEAMNIETIDDIIAYLERFEDRFKRGKLAMSTVPEEDESVRFSKGDTFSQSNKALVKILKQLNVPNAEDAIKENKEDRAEFAKVWNAEWKNKDKTLSIGVPVGTVWRGYIEEAILSRRQEVPGYDLLKDDILDMVTTGIEVGENGIPYLVRSWDPSKRQLTSHIFDNLANRLNGIIQNKFPQFGKITVQVDTTTTEGKVTGVDLTTTEDVETTLKKQAAVKEAQEISQKEQTFRKDVGITEKMVVDFKQEVGELLKNPKLGIVTEFEFYQNFRDKITAVKKLYKAMSNHIGTANSSKFKQFLKDIRPKYIKNAPTSDLVQIEKMVKGKKVLTTFKHRATTKEAIKEAVDQGLLKSFEVKTDEQGPAVYEKQNVNESDFVNVFFGKRGRRESLIKNMVNMIGMDAVFTVLRENKEVKEAFDKNNIERGVPPLKLLGELANKIGRDIEVNFSKGMAKDEKIIFANNAAKLAKEYQKNGGDITAAFNDIFTPAYLMRTTEKGNKSGAFRNSIIKKLEEIVTGFKGYTVAAEQAGLKVKDLPKYIEDKLLSKNFTPNSARNIKGLSKKDVNVNNKDQIKSARKALKKVIKKLGLSKVNRFLKDILISGSQIGNTNLVPVSLTSFVDSKVEDKIQKLIDKALLPGDIVQEDGVKVEYSKLTQREYEKLEKYLQANYKSRPGYGIVNGKDDLNKHFTKGLKDDGKKYTKKTPQNTDWLKNKTIDQLIKEYPSLLESTKEEINFLIELMDVLKELENANEINANDVAIIMMVLNSGMNSPISRAASFRYAFVDKNGKLYKGKTTWEHMTTRAIISSFLTMYQNGDFTKAEIKTFLNSLHVSNLPDHLNTLLTELGFQYKMQSDFYKDGELNKESLDSKKRYDNENVKLSGRWDMVAIDLSTGKTVFEDLAAASRFIKPDTNKHKIVEEAVNFSRGVNPTKGMSVWDFDDTIAKSKSMVLFTSPTGQKGVLTAEQFASDGANLLDQGYKFDFSEFNKVVKGEKGPFFKKFVDKIKKFGVKDNFILTARPVEAAPAIQEFLKSVGVDIPLKNITALANSTAEAKALWITEKIGKEGYNDLYFADDALQNVQAVKNIMEQLDIKGKVQQAKINFSKGMSGKFNKILQDVTGIEASKRFSQVKARKRGASRGKFKFFIPPSHEDFVGLLYNFMGKGEQGNKHRDFFENALIKPLNRAYIELNTAKQSIANDYKKLKKEFSSVTKKLTKKTPDGDFTFQDAIRVYLWNKHGYDIPGLSKSDVKSLSDIVKKDKNLLSFAELLNLISKQEQYIKPTEGWEAADIRVDLDDATGRVGRAQFFEEFTENADEIFSQENLNKIEAAYGRSVREAIEDILYRTKTGRNRPQGQNRLVNRMMNYLNGAVGSVMFFNIRSSVLQQMSTVNFLNFGDNNIFKAAVAFANQKQFWADWAMLFNSDFMKQRRGGIQTDVNGAELADIISKSKYPIRSLTKELLRIGFLPTQIGDNIAIANGGATMYRNRVNTYLKQGLSKKEAETRAFEDFIEVAESTQQSARPDKISQQQASPLGRLILAFQNVTSQFNRIGKKAFLDIKNRRITPPYKTQMQSDIANSYKILYYFGVQNLIFYGLQSALFAAMFSDDPDDEKFLKKKERIINGSIDSILRGLGIGGAVVATIKNMAIKFAEQRKATYNEDEGSVMLEALNLSPPLGIKARKIHRAEKTLNINEKVIQQMNTFDIDNPLWSAVTSYTEAVTNLPVNRLYNKTQNVRQSLNSDHENWQRALMFMGWSQYNLGIENEEIERVRRQVQSNQGLSKPKKTKYKHWR